MGRIFIPDAVNGELLQIDGSWKNQKPAWISVETLPAEKASQVISLCASGYLGIGEAEAILLANHLKADWLLTDDTSARIFGSLLGVEVHGSLGVILWSAARGHLTYDEAKVAVEKLGRTSLWISQSILKKAQRALDVMFDSHC
jgi:predicted nucleic acid-binding protein